MGQGDHPAEIPLEIPRQSLHIKEKKTSHKQSRRMGRVRGQTHSLLLVSCPATDS